MFEKLKKAIEDYNSIVIFGHPNPDGDCYGSQLGLRDTIRLNYPNKKVYAVGTGLRRFRNTLGRMDVIEDSVIAGSLAILVDGNDLNRMEDQRVWSAKAWIKIDHHVENGKFTQGEFVVDEQANSTCELITMMIWECGWKINPKIADLLYLGIVTDSGRFQYIERFPEAFEEARWLCEQGANPKALNNALNITPETALKFRGYVYSHYQKTDDGVIYLTLDKNTIAKFGLTAARAGNMVNLLSYVQGYPIWVFFTETEESFMHVEFRSNGPAVQPIATSLGGGGHKMAAGLTLPQYDKKSIDEIIEMCNAALREYQKSEEQ